MILDEFRLDGKVAIVTGGGRGLGKVMALALAEAGADVVVAARTAGEIAQTASEVKGLGRKSLAISTDVTKANQVTKMVGQTISEFGKIDILVNNAGLGLEKPALKTTVEEWDTMIRANLTSAFLCCKAVAKHMVERKSGTIINIASGLGERGVPGAAAYCASKGGVIQLTKVLALEWASYGVRVNAIGPGWFPPSSAGQNYEPAAEILPRYIPLGRRGEPADVAGAVIYLASDSSSFMTGETIFIEGGVLSHA